MPLLELILFPSMSSIQNVKYVSILNWSETSKMNFVRRDFLECVNRRSIIPPGKVVYRFSV